VLVGHVTRDLLEDGPRAGGTALYAGVAAARLDRQVAIATACADDIALPPELADRTVWRRPSTRTTTFSIAASPGGRTLRLLERAPTLRAEDVPVAWRHGSSLGSGLGAIIHLAPVADDVPPTAATWFGRGERVVATPQGWLRNVDAAGLVSPSEDGLDNVPIEGLGALVFSVEDVGGDEAAVGRIASRVAVAVVTRGASGATLHMEGRVVDIPACPAHEVDETGAGDVFAAAFFVRLAETGDAVASAYFASCAAALSVEGPGLSHIPFRKQVEARLDVWAEL
jgi:sugar/nucleoside kinase (ribokinase family)